MRSGFLALCFGLGTLLAACGGGSETGPGGNDGASAAAPGNGPRLSGLLYLESNDPLDAQQVMVRDMSSGQTSVALAGNEAFTWGGEIAYLSSCSPLAQRLSLADSDGFSIPVSDCFEISAIEQNLQHPVPSPDGQFLVVTNTQMPAKTDSEDIYEQLQASISNYAATMVFTREGEMVAEYVDFGPATFTQDGDLIMAGLGETAGFGVFRVGRDFAKPERIDDGRLSGPIRAITPHPRRERVTFIHNSQIFEMDLGDGKPSRIHSHGYPIAALAYSPRGDKIAYVSDDPLSEAMQTGIGYSVFILEDGEYSRIEVPFIPGGPLSWVEK